MLCSPSHPPHHWQNGAFAPKDGVGGGTWLGVSDSGNVAVLTNFREPTGGEKWPNSRGAVVSSFLSDADVTPSEYMTRLHDQDDQAGGYNVLCGNIFSGSLWFHSNRAGQGSRELPAGLHAVSNGPMTNEWAKMRRGLDVLPDVLQEIDAAYSSTSWDTLFNIMHDDTLLCTEESAPDTGMPADLEVEFSRMFIPGLDFKESRYGTRSQSLIFITYGGQVDWVERTRQPDDSWQTEHSSFQMHAPPAAAGSEAAKQHEEL